MKWSHKFIHEVYKAEEILLLLGDPNNNIKCYCGHISDAKVLSTTIKDINKYSCRTMYTLRVQM